MIVKVSQQDSILGQQDQVFPFAIPIAISNITLPSTGSSRRQNSVMFLKTLVWYFHTESVLHKNLFSRMRPSLHCAYRRNRLVQFSWENAINIQQKFEAFNKFKGGFHVDKKKKVTAPIHLFHHTIHSVQKLLGLVCLTKYGQWISRYPMWLNIRYLVKIFMPQSTCLGYKSHKLWNIQYHTSGVLLIQSLLFLYISLHY